MTGGIVDGGSFRTFTPGVAILKQNDRSLDFLNDKIMLLIT